MTTNEIYSVIKEVAGIRHPYLNKETEIVTINECIEITKRCVEKEKEKEPMVGLLQDIKEEAESISPANHWIINQINNALNDIENGK